MKDDPNHNEPTTAPLGAFVIFLVFAAVVLVLLSGCTGGVETTTTAPSQVAIPVQPPRPNVGMTVEQIQRVEEKVLRVEGAVDEVVAPDKHQVCRVCWMRSCKVVAPDMH